MIYLSERQWRALEALHDLSLWLPPTRMLRRLRELEAERSELRLRLACAELTIEALTDGDLETDERPANVRHQQGRMTGAQRR